MVHVPTSARSASRIPRRDGALAGDGGNARLVDLTVAIVGPGRVGASLAHWLGSCGARIATVIGRDQSATVSLAERVGAQGRLFDETPSLAVDLVLIAVADDAIREVAAKLAATAEGGVALHCAGRLGASSLAPLAAVGLATGSFHPLRAFPEPSRHLAEASGTLFAVDGSPPARELAARLAGALGGRTAIVEEAQRSIYHLAASLAAGGVTSLVATAIEVAARLGLDREVGAGYRALAAQALDALPTTAAPAAAAITGPAARGDAAVLESIGELQGLAPDLAATAALAAIATLRVRRAAGLVGPAHERLERGLVKLLSRPDFVDPPPAR